MRRPLAKSIPHTGIFGPKTRRRLDGALRRRRVICAERSENLHASLLRVECETRRKIEMNLRIFSADFVAFHHEMCVCLRNRTRRRLDQEFCRRGALFSAQAGRIFAALRLKTVASARGNLPRRNSAQSMPNVHLRFAINAPLRMIWKCIKFSFEFETHLSDFGRFTRRSCVFIFHRL